MVPTWCGVCQHCDLQVRAFDFNDIERDDIVELVLAVRCTLARLLHAFNTQREAQATAQLAAQNAAAMTADQNGDAAEAPAGRRPRLAQMKGDSAKDYEFEAGSGKEGKGAGGDLTFEAQTASGHLDSSDAQQAGAPPVVQVLSAEQIALRAEQIMILVQNVMQAAHNLTWVDERRAHSHVEGDAEDAMLVS